MSGKRKKNTNSNSEQKEDAKEVSLQIYARVRGLMPWEPRIVSLSVEGKSVKNKSGKVVNQYAFQHVFKPQSTNEQVFKVIVMPMISNVLKGFNALLVAYGQTGSGKTFSMLGKPKLNIVGLLPRMLSYMVQQKSVTKVELSAVEAFGHHVAKIFLFDLYDEANQVRDWNKKKGVTTLDPKKANKVEIVDAQDAHDKIIYAHGASHFAPTGKNPESSRGHVTFVASVWQKISKHQDKVSYFVMVDCAGSEGETAFTPDFKARVDKETLMCRRLEAGTINTGLSQLQVIFNQLRVKGKLSKVLGNGVRRVLHPFINTQTYLSVLFTLSPSINNAKATESTLKFAVTAGMVKVRPVLTNAKMNYKQLVAELKAHIDSQEEVIEENNDKIAELRREIDRVQSAIERVQSRESAPAGGGGAASNGAQKQRKLRKRVVTKMVTREVRNERTGKMQLIEEEKEVEEEYYVNADDTESVVSAMQMEDEVQNAVMDVLDDAANDLVADLGQSFKEEIEAQQLRSHKGVRSKRKTRKGRTMTVEENDEAMKLAIAQYSQLMVPWQKEAMIKKHKKQKQKEKEAMEKQMVKQRSKGLLKIDEHLKQSQNDYKRLEEKQREIQKLINDPNSNVDRETLTDHAMELQIMLKEQEALCKSLEQSKAIIIDHLKLDGREALVRFFQMRGII